MIINVYKKCTKKKKWWSFFILFIFFFFCRHGTRGLHSVFAQCELRSQKETDLSRQNLQLSFNAICLNCKLISHGLNIPCRSEKLKHKTQTITLSNRFSDQKPDHHMVSDRSHFVENTTLLFQEMVLGTNRKGCHYSRIRKCHQTCGFMAPWRPQRSQTHIQ